MNSEKKKNSPPCAHCGEANAPNLLKVMRRDKEGFETYSFRTCDNCNTPQHGADVVNDSIVTSVLNEEVEALDSAMELFPLLTQQGGVDLAAEMEKLREAADAALREAYALPIRTAFGREALGNFKAALQNRVLSGE